MSARSVLDALDPDKYAIIQIGITHDGTWFGGENVLEAMLAGQTDQLSPSPCFLTQIMMVFSQLFNDSQFEHYC